MEAKKAKKSKLPKAWGERTVVQYGIELPYTTRAYPSLNRPSESGTVFITEDKLYELAEQGRYDSQFGSVFLVGYHEGLALEQAGLAVQETRGGYHRSETLNDYLRKLEKNR